MEPPICYVCGDDFRATDFNDDAATGGLVEFRPAANDRDLPDGMCGHPDNLGWFCKLHFSAADELRQLTRSEAMLRLRERYP